MSKNQLDVVGGVDTHRDNHVAAAVDSAGRLLGTASFPATGTGYGELLAWLASWGQLARVGVEGTGSYGAGLARHLAAAGVAVVEVAAPRKFRCDRRRSRGTGRAQRRRHRSTQSRRRASGSNQDAARRPPLRRSRPALRRSTRSTT